MNGARAGKATNPHVAAGIASVFVIVTGAAVGAYLMRFRGSPAGVPLSTAELGILAGGLAAVAVATHFAVAAAVQQAAAGLRALLAHALELDATDPQAAEAFEAEPQLRDLVNMWIGEKTQARELGDRLETMRGEIDGVIAGMSRSAQDQGRLRTDNLSPVGVQIASLWNVMLETVRQANAAAPGDASPATASGAAAAAAPAPEVRALVSRLDELESELERLRTRVQEPAGTLVHGSSLLQAGVPLDRLPLLQPEAGDEVQEDLLFTPSVQAEPEWGDVHIVDPPVHARTWQLAGAPLEVLDPGSPVEVVAVTPGTGRPAPVPAPAPAVPPDGTMRFEDLDFPHFVGQPVRDVAGRVAVTYGADAADDANELPASALLFDDEPAAPPGAFNLRRALPSERSS